MLNGCFYIIAAVIAAFSYNTSMMACLVYGFCSCSLLFTTNMIMPFLVFGIYSCTLLLCYMVASTVLLL